MSVKLDSLNTVAEEHVAHFNPYLDEFGIIKSNSKLTKLDRGYETKISRHSTSKIRLYETSGHKFALSV